MTRIKQARNYTREEIDFITQNVSKYYVPQLVKMFNDKFNANMTIYKMKNFKNRYNLKSNLPKNPLTGNKKRRYNLTRSEWLNKVKHKIGYEYISKDGYKYIKIKDTVNATDNYLTKAKFNYIKKFGKIPKGYSLIHLDGNKQNDKIENLALVNYKTLSFLNRKKLLFKNKQLNETSLLLADLTQKSKERAKSL